MVALKIKKLSGGLGVLIPKEVLAELNVTTGDTIYLTSSDHGFHLTAYNQEFAEQIKMAHKIIKEDKAILRALAK